VAATVVVVMALHDLACVNALVRCSILYDVTRVPRTVVNCYELR
jgi:hypothetical protein